VCFPSQLHAWALGDDLLGGRLPRRYSAYPFALEKTRKVNESLNSSSHPWRLVCLSQVTLTGLSNNICFAVWYASSICSFNGCSLLIILICSWSSSRIKKRKGNSSVLARRYHKDFIHCFIFLSTICFASLPLKAQRKYFKTFQNGKQCSFSFDILGCFCRSTERNPQVQLFAVLC